MTNVKRDSGGALLRAIEGIYTYGEFAACALAFVPIMGAVSLVHRGDEVPRVPGRWMRRFGRVTSALTPLWKFSVEGAPPPDIRTKPYVVVANHVSMADPFLLSWLDWDMQWVIKEELRRLPVAGLLLRFGGDIALRRGSGESVRAMLDECRHALRGGLPVMIFPEGTRSGDGSLAPFKDGAFELAIELQVPVLPIAIAGTQRCVPKDSRWLGRARAIARVLPAIETAGMTPEDLPALRERAREEIGAAAAELEAKLAH